MNVVIQMYGTHNLSFSEKWFKITLKRRLKDQFQQT